VQSKLLHETDGTTGSARTFAVVFDSGDDPADGLCAFAEEHDVGAAHLTGLGAFREATLGFYAPDTQEYERIPVREQAEVLSLTGNVARYDGAPKLHAHVVLGRRGGEAVGGHLMSASVRPTLEVTLVETPPALHREMDEASGLPLIALGKK
jgi:predicted DNA-binding protein with PD1-like motif